ncbi:MAG: hypothetical protein ACRBBS_07145 [Thalassovita sp.]
MLKDNYNAAADDPAYATAVFEPIVPFAHVLASREYHLIGEDWPNWDCTYAIVELSPNAPETPPSRIEDSDGFLVNWRYRFGGDWLPTPKPPLPDNTRDALGFCAQYFDDDLIGRMEKALANPGSWFALGRVGETLFIYSLPQKVAARIRFGD